MPVYNVKGNEDREFTGTATRGSLALYDRGQKVASFTNLCDVALADRIASLLNADESYRADNAYREKLQQDRNKSV